MSVVYFESVAVICFPTLDSSQHPLCSPRTLSGVLMRPLDCLELPSIGEQPLANYYQKGVH